jgi:hypothetical protein
MKPVQQIPVNGGGKKINLILGYLKNKVYTKCKKGNNVNRAGQGFIW